VSVALFAGSFDPIHLGHLGLIERAAPLHDELIVGVLANPDKPAGLFEPAERVRLIEGAVAHLEGVRVVQFHGLTTDLARREGATVLVRAAHKEMAFERSMAATNELLAGIPTTLVPGDPTTVAISATVVRTLVANGHLGPAQDLVPAVVKAALAERADRLRPTGRSTPTT
jgi:pantetheine-phosphate adenylyltransferase